MELREKTRNVETNTEGKAFTIKASAKAFKILSDSLYSDKITSIIRELSTNAYDSHISVGDSDKPFHVHLPTQDESYFSIRDFGNSMTHDQVMNLYTTYFGSDKTDSNEFVGALGLGSKSPFSYADSFTITAILDGEKRSYVAFFDENGTPNISVLNKTKSEDPQGVEIRFEVEHSDIGDFVEKATKVYQFFDIKPEILGLTDYRHHIENPIIETRDWTIIKGNNYHSDCYAIQGNIAYKINVGYLTSYEALFVAENNFRVKFDIGQLDVSASRESLSYDKITIENIEKRFAQVYHEFISEINNIISLKKSEWAAKLAVKNMLKSFNSSSNIVFRYNEKDLRYFTGYKVNLQDFTEIKIIKYDYVSHYSGDRYDRTEISKRSDKLGSNEDFLFPIENDIIFVMNDGSKNKVGRVRLLALESGNNVYLIENSTRKFMNAVGNPPTIKLAKLKELPKKESVSYLDNKYYSPYDRERQRFDEKKAISMIQLPKGKKFYIELKNHHIIKFGMKKIQNVYKEVELSKELGFVDLDNFVLFGVKSSETKTKRFAKLKMIEFFNYIKNKIEKRASDLEHELNEYFASSVEFNSLNKVSHISKMIFDDKEHLNKISSTSKVHEINNNRLIIEKTHKYFDSENNEINQLIEIAKLFYIKIRVETQKASDNIDTLENYYPMLEYVDRWAHDMSLIIDYINMVDKIRSLE